MPLVLPYACCAIRPVLSRPGMSTALQVALAILAAILSAVVCAGIAIAVIIAVCHGSSI